MKAPYKDFEVKENSFSFITVPPAGVYIGEIKGARVVDADEKRDHDSIELMLEITEGECKGRFNDLYNDQKQRFDNAKYKGILRMNIPQRQDHEEQNWTERFFSGQMWCIEQSNPGYHWEWDEGTLAGKKIGINIRKRLYTYNEQDRETTEIARLETVEDVRSGKAKPARERDQRDKDYDTDRVTANDSGYTQVNTSELPW